MVSNGRMDINVVLRRKRPWITKRIIPALASRDKEKTQASVRIAGILIENRTRDLLKTKQEYQPLNETFGEKE
jgi:hypothetical protein